MRACSVASTAGVCGREALRLSPWRLWGRSVDAGLAAQQALARCSSRWRESEAPKRLLIAALLGELRSCRRRLGQNFRAVNNYWSLMPLAPTVIHGIRCEGRRRVASLVRVVQRSCFATHRRPSGDRENMASCGRRREWPRCIACMNKVF